MHDLSLGAGEHLLFFGDSITEATEGFVAIVRDLLDARYPEKRITVTNAGVGGDKTTSLQARLQRDVLDRKPDVVVTMIGVNDVWHGETGVPLDEYTERLRQLVLTMKSAGIRQVLMTPTVIGEDLLNEDNRKLEGYVDAMVEIGKANGIPVIPLRKRFARVLEERRSSEGELLLTADGVHPNREGHLLIAVSVLEELGFDFAFCEGMD